MNQSVCRLSFLHQWMFRTWLEGKSRTLYLFHGPGQRSGRMNVLQLGQSWLRKQNISFVYIGKGEWIWINRHSYIDVGDVYWKWVVMVTTFGWLWPIWYAKNHQNYSFVAIILSPTSIQHDTSILVCQKRFIQITDALMSRHFSGRGTHLANVLIAVLKDYTA